MTTDAQGRVTYTFYPPEIGGLYTIAATYAGTIRGTDTVHVGLPFNELLASAHDTLIGENADRHPRNHFATSEMIRDLEELADTLFAVTGHKLLINDESLEGGGLFDINGQWARPHCTHRDGRSADVRTNVALGVAREDSLLITRWWTRTFGAGTAQPEARPPHTHLQSP